MMNAQDQFREGLTLLMGQAETSQNQMTTDQIRSCFGDLKLSEEQWKMVYQYLERNQIEVTDREEEEAEEASPVSESISEETEDEELHREVSESQYLSMYMEELEAILPLEEEEIPELLTRMQAGDEAARERLIEGHLSFAAKAASIYTGKGLAEADLIQEANVALMIALADYQGNADGLKEAIGKEIRRSLEEILGEEKDNGEISEYLVNQANTLLTTSAEMAEDLGREPTLQELCTRLNMTEDAVRELMKMSLDAVNAQETQGGTIQ